MPRIVINTVGGLITRVHAPRGTVVSVHEEDTAAETTLVTEPLEALGLADEPRVFVYGNPADGFSFVGPLDNQSHAERYAAGEPGDWWLAPLEWPAEES